MSFSGLLESQLERAVGHVEEDRPTVFWITVSLMKPIIETSVAFLLVRPALMSLQVSYSISAIELLCGEFSLHYPASYTVYEFQVQAVNELGPGALSDPTEFTTPESGLQL